MKAHFEPSKRQIGRIEKNFGDEFYNFLMEGGPITYQEAMASKYAPFRNEATSTEFKITLWSYLIYFLRVKLLDVSGYLKRN